jgi:hypothetical protein
MWLARTVAKTVDVDGMLANMTPQQFDEWMVAFALWDEPVGSESPRGNLGEALATAKQMAGV